MKKDDLFYDEVRAKLDDVVERALPSTVIKKMLPQFHKQNGKHICPKCGHSKLVADDKNRTICCENGACKWKEGDVVRFIGYYRNINLHNQQNLADIIEDIKRFCGIKDIKLAYMPSIKTAIRLRYYIRMYLDLTNTTIKEFCEQVEYDLEKGNKYSIFQKFIKHHPYDGTKKVSIKSFTEFYSTLYRCNIKMIQCIYNEFQDVDGFLDRIIEELTE